MKLQSSAISASSFFATKSLVSRVIIGSTLALMGLQIAPAETVLYGGLGGHGVSSGPQASTNDGALVIVSQIDGSTRVVGHPAGVANHGNALSHAHP